MDAAGYFGPSERLSECITCDLKGDFYQVPALSSVVGTSGPPKYPLTNSPRLPIPMLRGHLNQTVEISFFVVARSLCVILRNQVVRPVSCNIRVHQENSSASACEQCPENSGRRIEVLNASTRLSCVCKEGDPTLAESDSV